MEEFEFEEEKTGNPTAPLSETNVEMTEQQLGEETENRNRKYFVLGILGASVILFLILVGLILALTLGSTSEPPGHKHPFGLYERKTGSSAKKEGRKMLKTGSTDKCINPLPPVIGLQHTWTEKIYTQGESVNYTCFNNNTGLEELYITAICLNGEWHQIFHNESSCVIGECLEGPPQDKMDRVNDWDNNTRLIGTRVHYKCSNIPDSPAYKVSVCVENGTWIIQEEDPENCTCGWPQVFSSSLYFDRNEWKGRVSIGDSMNFTCPSLTLSAERTFLMLQCQPDLSWKVINSHACYFLVDAARNATKANDYCQQHSAELVVVESTQEQKKVVKILRGNKVFTKKCHHRAFIGLREDISLQWKDYKGNSLSPLSETWGWLGGESDATCAFVSRENYHVISTSCKKTEYCHLCQFETSVISNELDANLAKKCQGRDDSCIVPFGPPTNFGEAKGKCESQNGTLASIIGFRMLQSVREMIEADPKVENCKGFFIGLQAENRIYETFSGESTGPLLLFGDKKSRNLKKHCVIVHEFQRFRWTDESCSHPSCFICKTQGIPIDSFFTSIEITPARRFWATEEPKNLTMDGNDYYYDDVADENNCLLGWVHKGHHCFYYNKSLATNAEAIATCQTHNSVLASLANAYERNFILDHLMNFYSKISPMWHVQNSVGLPFHQLKKNSTPPADDDGSGTCVLLHLQPQLTWSRDSCNRKASFVCHSR